MMLGWLIDPDGRCVSSDGSEIIPDFAIALLALEASGLSEFEFIAAMSVWMRRRHFVDLAPHSKKARLLYYVFSKSQNPTCGVFVCFVGAGLSAAPIRPGLRAIGAADTPENPQIGATPAFGRPSGAKSFVPGLRCARIMRDCFLLTSEQTWERENENT